MCDFSECNEKMEMPDFIDDLRALWQIHPVYLKNAKVSIIQLMLNHEIQLIMHVGKKKKKISSLIQCYGITPQNGYYWALGFHKNSF